MARVDTKKTHTRRKDRLHIRPDQILERHNTILLTSHDYRFFLKALDDDCKPSKRSHAPLQSSTGAVVGGRCHVDTRTNS